MEAVQGEIARAVIPDTPIKREFESPESERILSPIFSFTIQAPLHPPKQGPTMNPLYILSWQHGKEKQASFNTNFDGPPGQA